MRAIWTLFRPSFCIFERPTWSALSFNRLNRRVEEGLRRIDGILHERLDVLLVRYLDSLVVHGDAILHVPARLVSSSGRQCHREHKREATLSVQLASSATMKGW